MNPYAPLPTPITEAPRGNESVTPDQVRSRVERLFHSANMSLVEWNEVANDLLGSATRIADLQCQLTKTREQRDAAWQTLKDIRQLFVDDESFGATVETLFAKPLEEAEAEITRLNALISSQ